MYLTKLCSHSKEDILNWKDFWDTGKKIKGVDKGICVLLFSLYKDKN